jgi:Zn-dependent protease with chaperone function
MNARHFELVYRELIEENPLAIRAVLKVLRVEFTDTVPTLAVTCEARPRLLVNLGFVREHCRTEPHIKAVICHEFLHVLLRHTEHFTTLTEAEHLAVDAVINAIIHRSLGPEYSGMMSRYYADEKGAARLLRPPSVKDLERMGRIRGRFLRVRAEEARVLFAWKGLYDGRLVADDIRDLARDLVKPNRRTMPLLGDHENLAGKRSGTVASTPEVKARGTDTATPTGVLAEALDTALKSMNGSGVFRSPNGRGLAPEAYRNEVRAAETSVDRWRRETYAILRRHLLPDPRSIAREPSPRSFALPVLSPGDRRAALRSLWSPFLPDARWETEHTARAGSAHVYLDVSGSMNAETPLIVALLGRLSTYIRRPFWAFSNVVAPARIERGRLIADTTGGTSMGCVLDHLARTKPHSAIVVTDGYIEALSPQQVAATAGTRLHVIVTRDGNAALLQRAGLSYTQLSRLSS